MNLSDLYNDEGNILFNLKSFIIFKLLHHKPYCTLSISVLKANNVQGHIYKPHIANGILKLIGENCQDVRYYFVNILSHRLTIMVHATPWNPWRVLEFETHFQGHLKKSLNVHVGKKLKFLKKILEFCGENVAQTLVYGLEQPSWFVNWMPDFYVVSNYWEMYSLYCWLHW